MFQTRDIVTNQDAPDREFLTDFRSGVPLIDDIGRSIPLFSKLHSEFARRFQNPSISWQPGWSEFWDGTKFKRVGDGSEVIEGIESGRLLLPEGFSADDPVPTSGPDTRISDPSSSGSLISRFGKRHLRLAADNIRERWLGKWPRFYDASSGKFRSVSHNRREFITQISRGEVFPPHGEVLNLQTRRFIKNEGTLSKKFQTEGRILFNRTFLVPERLEFKFGDVAENIQTFPVAQSDYGLVTNEFRKAVDPSKRTYVLIKIHRPSLDGDKDDGWRTLKHIIVENQGDIDRWTDLIPDAIEDSFREAPGSDPDEADALFDEIMIVTKNLDGDGGCFEKRTNQKGKKTKINGIAVKYWSSKNNNCAFTTLNHAMRPIMNIPKFKKRLGLEIKEKIDFRKDYGRKIAEKYGCNIRVMNTIGGLIVFIDIDAEQTAELILKGGHYFLAIATAFREKYCDSCHETFYAENHKCDARKETFMRKKLADKQKEFIVRQEYKTNLTLDEFEFEDTSEEAQRQRQRIIDDVSAKLDAGKIEVDPALVKDNFIRRKGLTPEQSEGIAVMRTIKKLKAMRTKARKGQNIVRMNHDSKSMVDRLIQKDRHHDIPKFLKNTIIYDFETFDDTEVKVQRISRRNGHQVYAVGYWYRGQTVILYGENAISDFMDFLKTIKHAGTRMVSYNGSGFDHFLIMRELKKRNVKPKIIRKGSKIMELKFWKLKSLDLFLFLGPRSLGSACKSFNMEHKKGHFPHCFPHEWRDVFYKGKAPEARYYPDRMRHDIMEEYGDFTKFNDAMFPKINPVYPRTNWFNFQEVSTEYLIGDITCTLLLYLEFGKQMFIAIGMDIRDCMTLPSAAYKKWVSMIREDIKIQVPNTEDKFRHIGVYGGRTEVIQRYWISEDVNKDYEDIDDFLVDEDVVSLYPSAMMGEFPIGESVSLKDEERHAINRSLMNFKGDTSQLYLPIGDYICDVVPRKDLVVAPIALKEDDDHTCWELKDRTNQKLNWIDIESAVRHGYKVMIRSGYVYPANQCLQGDEARIFKDYVELLYAGKQAQDALKKAHDPAYNECLRSVYKLFMNALYGKCTQKPINDEIVFCSTGKDMDRFFEEYNWLDIMEYGDQVIMIGSAMEFSQRISKPMQEGAAVLAYSRAIMNDIFDCIDPTRLRQYWRYLSDEQKQDLVFLYTDTDSIIVHVKHMHKIKHFLVPHGEKKKLGQLEDELEKNMKVMVNGVESWEFFPGKIVEAIFLSPKTYALKYVLPSGEIGHKLTTDHHIKKRAKGLPSFLLKWEHYVDALAGKTIHFRFDMMSKINSIHTASCGTKPELFSIHTRQNAKRSLRDSWKRREYLDSDTKLITVPKGYVNDPKFDYENGDEDMGRPAPRKLMQWLGLEENTDSVQIEHLTENSGISMDGIKSVQPEEYDTDEFDSVLQEQAEMQFMDDQNEYEEILMNEMGW